MRKSTGRKRVLFRVLAVAIIPAMLVVGELALRLAGWGYPTAFFIPTNGNSAVYRENPKFGWRFFPASVARVPEPIRLSKKKPPGTCRIFVFGESAALGDPEPAYSFSRVMRELLEARFPGTRFEVVNVAMTAISSHAVLRIAGDCIPFDADLWIIYMGNNEVIGPFGPGSAFGATAPSMPLIRATLLLKETRLGQWFDQTWQRRSNPVAGTPQWEGMRMMLQHPIRASDPVLARVYRHLRINLEEMLTAAARARAQSIVCSVASNLKDCPPFLSLHRPGLPEAGRARWEKLLAEGTESEEQGAVAQGFVRYRQAAEIDPTYAALRFRMGRCQGALGNKAGAQEQLTAARDLDAFRFRSDSIVNQTIGSSCARDRTGQVRFLDLAAELRRASGVPGAESFWDHVHFNFAGNYSVARRLAEEVVSLSLESLRQSKAAPSDWLSEQECADRLALTLWDERPILQRMSRRVEEPPFTDQLDHKRLLERWSQRAAELEQKLNQEGMQRAVAVYRQALTQRPDDWVLHYRFGFLLEATGDRAAAAAQWQQVVAQIPEYADAWFKLADMNAAQARLDEAEKDYGGVLRLRPGSFEALNGLGLVYMSEGKQDQAAACFERALHLDPKFAQAHVNLGLLFMQRGKAAAAEAHYREALRVGANESAGAHTNLANLLADQGKQTEAIQHYAEALRLQPNAARVHLSLANSLVATGHAQQGLAQYREAIRLDPLLPEAQFNLGVALAKSGDLAGATTCFRGAAQLNPQDAQAFLNLGVALAQQNQIAEATRQFETVLRLDPNNAAARRFLETALARRSKAQ